MKISNLIAAVLALTGAAAHGQVIVADNYNVAEKGTGFFTCRGRINAGVDSSVEWRNATNAMYRLENPSRSLPRNSSLIFPRTLPATIASKLFLNKKLPALSRVVSPR